VAPLHDLGYALLKNPQLTYKLRAIHFCFFTKIHIDFTEVFPLCYLNKKDTHVVNETQHYYYNYCITYTSSLYVSACKRTTFRLVGTKMYAKEGNIDRNVSIYSQ